jgi:hypothetical protein
LPKLVLHRMRSSTSFFNLQYSFSSIRLSSSCLCLLPRFYVTSIIPSITRFRRHFLRNMWPIQLAFLLFIFFVWYSCHPRLFVTLLHSSNDRSDWYAPFFSSTIFQVFLSTFGSVQVKVKAISA